MIVMSSSTRNWLQRSFVSGLAAAAAAVALTRAVASVTAHCWHEHNYSVYQFEAQGWSLGGVRKCRLKTKKVLRCFRKVAIEIHGNERCEAASSRQWKQIHEKSASQTGAWYVHCVELEQESWAIAKITARCAPYMSALEILGSPWLRRRILFPKFLMGFCSHWRYQYAYKIWSSYYSLLSQEQVKTCCSLHR